MLFCRFGIPLKVPDYLTKRIDAACTKIPVSEYDCKFIRPFMVSGFDVTELGTIICGVVIWLGINYIERLYSFYLGSLKSKHGGWVGIPVNYTYKSRSDIDKLEITLNHEPIKWDSTHGKLLQESMVLKEDEQVFGLARSILELSCWKLHLNILFAPACFAATYALSAKLNDKFQLFSRVHRAVS